MPKIRNIFQDLFDLSNIEDAYRQKLARYILNIFLAGLVMGTIIIFHYILIGFWLNAVFLTLLLGIMVACIKLIKQDRFETAFVIVAIMGICGLIITVSMGSTLSDSGIFLLFPTLVVFSFFASKRVNITVLITLIVWIWGFALMQYYGIIPIRELVQGELSQALALSLILIFSSLLLQFTATSMRTANQTLAEAKLQAEEASQAKSSFLAMMSHELRTPLNAIIGYSEVLLEEVAEEGNMDDEHELDLKRIKKSGHQLLAIINDILDISKIDANKMELSISVFSLAGLIQDTLEIATPLAMQHDNKLEVEIFDDLVDQYIKSDREKILQILLNLTSNAAKFTQRGKIKIQVKMADQLLIQVIDNGIGIEKEDLLKIFDSFEQIDNSMSRKTMGTGLGLAISKRLAKLIEGDLTVESELGDGSVFTLALPQSLMVFEESLESV